LRHIGQINLKSNNVVVNKLLDLIVKSLAVVN
jgi:hypothetical protein